MEKIRRLRVEVGMSQKTLAQGIGINKSTYSLLENERLKPLNIEDMRERAVNVLKPLLSKKLTEKKEEVERLENMLLMFNNQ